MHSASFAYLFVDEYQDCNLNQHDLILEIAAAIPAPWGRLAVFEGAGHGAWRDRPEEALAVLREFVAGPV